MKSELIILTPLVKKIIIVSLTIFFFIKISMITGFELSDYKKIISGEASDNIVHLDKINKDRDLYFSVLRDEIVQSIDEQKSIDAAIAKLKREISKPSLKMDNKARHETLLLSTSLFLALKDYAISNGISDKQLKQIQSLFKDYLALDVEFSGGLLKRDGMLFVPGRDLALDFLSPVYDLEQIKIEKEMKDKSLKEFDDFM